jgi:hypothetical protein
VSETEEGRVDWIAGWLIVVGVFAGGAVGLPAERGRTVHPASTVSDRNLAILMKMRFFIGLSFSQESVFKTFSVLIYLME